MLQAWEIEKKKTVAAGGGKALTAEDLRRVLVKQGAKFSGVIFVQIFLDLGAAYGAFFAGTLRRMSRTTGRQRVLRVQAVLSACPVHRAPPPCCLALQPRCPTSLANCPQAPFWGRVRSSTEGWPWACRPPLFLWLAIMRLAPCWTCSGC